MRAVALVSTVNPNGFVAGDFSDIGGSWACCGGTGSLWGSASLSAGSTRTYLEEGWGEALGLSL